MSDQAEENADRQQFEELYGQYSQLLYDYLARRTSADQAADLLQVTFLKAWEKRSSLQDPRFAKRWLFSIADNALIDAVRKQKSTAVLGIIEESAATDAPPEDHAAAAEDKNLVWTAAKSLEPRQFDVLNWTLRYDLGREDVAELLGVSASHASVLINRSHDALKNAVTTKLVAGQRDRCTDLNRLVPEMVQELSPDQRRSVDRHMRLCQACKSAATRLTQPSALFSTIGLVSLPQALRSLHWNAGQPATPSMRASSSFVRRHRNKLSALSLLLLIFGIGVAHVLPKSPQPTANANGNRISSVHTPSPADQWNAFLRDLTNASSYHVAFAPSGLGSSTIDISVAKAGDWYGTVAASDIGPGPTGISEPVTFAFHGGALYVEGGPGFVHDSANIVGINQSEAASLGSGWINLTSFDPSGRTLGMPVLQFVSASDLAQLLRPADTVTETVTTDRNGYKAETLSDGVRTLTITNGVFTLTSGDGTYVIDSLSAPFHPPAPSPLKTVQQLQAAN